MLICSLLFLTAGCAAIAEKTKYVALRQGTVVTTLEESNEISVLGPDKDGNLGPGKVRIPKGSLVQIGNPPAPEVKPTGGSQK